MIAAAREIFTHRNLLLVLTAREVKARYRGSVLGFLWSLINPLLLLVVYAFVFSVVLEQRALERPYALFLLSGLFAWIWFATALNEATVSLLANAGLIRRAVFPVAVLPLVPVLANLVHFAFALPVLAGGLLVGRYLGFPVSGPAALLLPAVVVLQLPLTGGLALGLAALQVHFKDVKDILGNLLTLLFFLTPVLYPVTALAALGPFRTIVKLSPMTPFILAYQDLLFRGRVPEPKLWLEMAAVALVAWALGASLFWRLKETLVEAA